MREAKDSGEVVEARLRAVLEPGTSGPVAGGGALSWDDLLPGWSEEDLAAGGHPLGDGSSDGVADDGASGGGSGRRDSIRPAGPAAVTGADAFGGERRAWLHAFDPGRPGVRALGAVAVVVVLVAALLAWRARPRVDEVGGSPGGAVTAESGAVGLPVLPVSPMSGSGEVVVAVGGKVRKPGLVRLAPGARVADALTAAGGAEPGVDVAVLNLARRVTDGELIMVGVSAPPGAVPGVVPGTAQGTLVNLNTATLSELDSLPGVGPVLAQRILDARDAQGGFRAVGDLRKVDGIGDARFEQLKDLVTV